MEKAANGSIKVEIFPAGQFGNDADTMSGLRHGTLDLAVAHDGAIAVIHKPIGILGIPFLTKLGVEVTEISPAALAQFRK